MLISLTFLVLHWYCTALQYQGSIIGIAMLAKRPALLMWPKPSKPKDLTIF